MRVVHEAGKSLSTDKMPRVTAIITREIIERGWAVEDYRVCVGFDISEATGNIPTPDGKDLNLAIRLDWLTVGVDAVIVLPGSVDNEVAQPSHGTHIEICHALMNAAVLKRGRKAPMAIDRCYKPVVDALLPLTSSGQRDKVQLIDFYYMQRMAGLGGFCADLFVRVRQARRNS